MESNNVDADYEEYRNNVQQYADSLHEYFKHLNHNYQDSYQEPGFSFSPVIDRTDQNQAGLSSKYSGKICSILICSKKTNFIFQVQIYQSNHCLLEESLQRSSREIQTVKMNQSLQSSGRWTIKLNEFMFTAEQ